MDTAQAVDFEPDLAATPLRENAPSKGKAGRKALASHLPRVEVRYELPETERVCGCGAALKEFDVETSEQLDYVPAKIRVIRHVKAKYACGGWHGTVKVASMPPQILPRTNASPGLLPQIATSKYVDGLPLYRLETVAERHGVNLSRATQAAWMIALVKPLQPLMNLMDERLRSSGYVRIDETPMQVLKSDKPASADHWMWVRAAGPPKERLILFDHDASRSSQVAERLLEGCHGYVHSDGYAAYDAVAVRLKLTHVGCMAHARRRFFEAIEALPHSERKQETAAHEMVRRIDALYAIECEIKTPDERTQARRERASPLLDKLIERAYALQNQTLPSGKLGEALAYLVKQWPKLARYVEDGRLEIDTNLAENAIRPFARGRRAWLFADSVSGAKASAMLYSLVEIQRRRTDWNPTLTCANCLNGFHTQLPLLTMKHCCPSLHLQLLQRNNMGNTWIVDLRHYLAPTGAMAPMPSRARLLAEYFANIVVEATTNLDDPPTLRCRRRPGHRRCSGIIFAVPSIDEDDTILWHCPVCHDNGAIRGWQGTLWDGFQNDQPAS